MGCESMTLDDTAQKEQSGGPLVHRYSSKQSMRSKAGATIDSQQQCDLVLRASRCRGTLYLVAFRILDDQERAEEAVRNCLLAISHLPASFESEGAFRCWLIRVLIDEALRLAAATSDR